MKKQNVLVVGAHPDDETLGCGGTIKALSKKYNIHLLVLGTGITSRDNWKQEDIMKLENQLYEAVGYLGIKKKNVDTVSFPDNMFDSVPLLKIVKVVSACIEKVQPHIVFTHFRNDLNVDHRKTYQAVLTACRPMSDSPVKHLYSFEVLSSTEWNYPTTFSPDFFVEINVQDKIHAMNEYETETRGKNHPRSLNCILSNSQTWGSKIGVDHAEAFETVFSILQP